LDGLGDGHKIGAFARPEDAQSQFISTLHAEDEGVRSLRSQASVAQEPERGRDGPEKTACGEPWRTV
jgi:hypothetical protein